MSMPRLGGTSSVGANHHGDRWADRRFPTSLGSFDARRMAGALGWFSIGLGLAGLLAPRRTARMIGVRDSHTAVRTLRIVGLRELACGVGILARPRPAGFLWARVPGDLMDLALLVPALTSRRARQNRVAVATAGVLGVTVLDAQCAHELSRATRGASRRRTVSVRRTITINRSPDELYRFWHDFTNLPRFMPRLESVQVLGERRSRWRARGPAGASLEWEAEIVDDKPNELIAWRSLAGSPVDHAGAVRFERAPGGRGTQVAVELEYTPPGGVVGATLAKALGRAPEQELQADLRRFKQLMETGEVVLSEGVLRGVAQPPEGEGRGAPRTGAMGGRR
jgi:uncharacterized membrane protein